MYFYKQNEQAIRQGPWFAYREHPSKQVELYLIEEDQVIAHNYATIYPKKVTELKHLMDTEHIPSEWYWNPGDDAKIFNAKVKKVEELGIGVKKYRPNGMVLMPWEKKEEQ